MKIKKMKRSIFAIIFSVVFLFVYGQEPSGYYNSAVNKTDNSLRLSLQTIIDNHTNIGYNALWRMYQDSDTKPNGKIWDMYSNCSFNYRSDQCGTYSNVCDCYNREHSIPKSWFGNASPMNSDGFHIFPTDGKVNGQRNNFPFGECLNGNSLGSNALGKLGASTFAGYSGTVFEPDNQYKGDFARTYFYMATRYANICNSWGNNTFGSQNNGLTTYAVDLFIKWHRQDPVSDKEKSRNDAIYQWQNNRNPFIDHPELAEHIWGDKRGEMWSPTSATQLVESDSFDVYPVPANDFVKISGSGTDTHFDYEIYSTTATLLDSGKSQLNKPINTTSLSDGVYLLKIKFGNKYFYKKIVINRQ